MVSIIIPIYNAGKYLEEYINSILKQTYKDWECILVNDGSSDGSDIICEYFTSNDKRFIYIYQNNSGVSIARNRGIEHANGEYLYFLDADDFITSDCIQTLANYAKLYNNPDIICAKIDTFGLDNIHYPFCKATKYINNPDHIKKSYYKHEWFEMPVNKLVRRSFIEKNKIYFYPNIRHEDTLWSFNLAYYAQSLLLIPHITYHYRINENSFITSRNYKLSSDSLLTVLKKIKDTIKEDKSTFTNNYYTDFISNIFISYFLAMDYDRVYKYTGYKTIRKLLTNLSIKDFINSPYSRGIKLFQVHRLLPMFFGYYFCISYYFIIKFKSKI